MKDAATLFETIKTTLSEMQCGDLSHMDMKTSLLEDGLNVDSVQLVQMISTLENKLGFMFEDADLRISTFERIENLISVIQSRL